MSREASKVLSDIDAGAREYFRHSTLTPVRVVGDNAQSKKQLGELLSGMRALGPRDEEKIIALDDRQARGRLEASVYPWVRICRLRLRCPDQDGVPVGAACIGTGWFAGPKTIITAGHVLYDVNWPERIETTPAWGAMADVWIGYREGLALGHANSAKFRVTNAWKDFVAAGAPEDERRAQIDIGCIQLGESLFDLPKYFDLNGADNAALTGEVATISGYPVDRDNGQIQYSGSGKIGAVSPSFFYHQIDTFGGQSGAPVWLGGTGVAQPSVVGIHTGGNEDEQKNWAVRMTSDVKALIQQWVDENP
jgi:glutamyl endopeptidase